MPDRVFIIHGWKAVPVEGWRPWLKTELGISGYTAIIPEMPDTVNPNSEAWVAHLQKEVKHPDAHTHFVGHSLGSAAILRYLETLPAGARIGKVVFVAGFASDIGIREIASFTAKPLNFEKIRSHSSDFTCIYSDNDPYVPTTQAELFQKNLGAKLVLIKDGKHFSSHEGYTQLPAALEAFAR